MEEIDAVPFKLDMAICDSCNSKKLCLFAKAKVDGRVYHQCRDCSVKQDWDAASKGFKKGKKLTEDGGNRLISNAVERIKESAEISDKNKEHILRFYDECYTNNLSDNRILFYMNRMLVLTRKWVSKDYDQMDKDDVKAMVRAIEQSDYAGWTKHCFKITIKKFFQILRKFDWTSKEYPEEVKWLKMTKNMDRTNNKEILTPDEVKSLIGATENTRDKALVSVIYESGCRIGEIMGVKIGDLEFDEYGVVMQVNGKTGQRPVRLVFSASLLSNWLSNHPYKDKETHVWTSLTKKGKGKCLTYKFISEMLKGLGKKTGIIKPLNPHNFRHSRASHMANKLTEAQMNIFFGWVQGSDMPRTYVHLTGRDIDKAILRLSGKIPKDEKEDAAFMPKLCPRCFMENSPEADVCMRCQMPLTQDGMDKARQKEKEFLQSITQEMIDKMIDNKVKQLMNGGEK